ncbi:MAG: transposase [Candidatus Paceibacterota bacterium]|jgi:putative transposase
MSRNFNISIGEFYHIYNRGVDKRNVFEKPNDYNRFLFLLYLCNNLEPVDLQKLFRQKKTFSEIFSLEIDKKLTTIGAYCLMPNHYHLLLKETRKNGISKFMQKLSTAYSMYFNIKHQRTGTLFQGRYKARHLDNDNHLKYLFAYIHLNPIKMIQRNWKEDGVENLNGAKKFLKGYKYSSYHEYIDVSYPQGSIINKVEFPEYFSSKRNFSDFIDEWLQFQSSENLDILIV